MNKVEQILAKEFPVSEQCTYLNHAAVAPWPRRTTEAVKLFADECTNTGASHYPQWLQVEQQLRERLGQLINAHDRDIALLKNTSEALSVVAHGFPWREADNVVISNEEFPSNRIVWESLGDKGVSVVEADLRSTESPEIALMEACNEKTRMLAISSVEYASGIKLNLKRLGEYCRQHSIAFCVDAIQGLGVFEHDVQAMHIDFLMADGHKWLLAPEGLAVFYCNPQWRNKLQLHQYGWHMVEDHFNFDEKNWQPALSARRFECGSPNMLCIFALNASLSLLLETGIAEIEKRVLERSRYLFDMLGRIDNVEILTPATPGQYAGIVSFRKNSINNEALFDYLKQHKVVCALRGNGVRFSPHFYTPMEVLEKAVQLVADAR